MFLQKNRCLVEKEIRKALVFALGLFLFSSCGHQIISLKQESSLDTHFKFKKIASAQNEAESSSVKVYQVILRPSLYSHCQYFPSDSVYSQILAKKCGTVASLFKTFDRFIRESDASYLGISMVETKYGRQFIELPISCEL